MPAKVTLNIQNIRDKIERFSLPKAQNIGRQKAQVIIKDKKKRFLDAYSSNKITQEIEAGEKAAASSLDVSGNLFSFIGFDAGSKPIEDLYYYFDNVIKITSGRGVYNKANKTLTFTMSLPTTEGIKKVTDLKQYTENHNENNWGTGLSWAFMIENGIPGLANYKFSTSPDILGGESRSTTGLQRKNSIHTGEEYKPREYITEMLKILTE